MQGNNLDPRTVGGLAATYLASIYAWDGYGRLESSSLGYSEDWTSYTGYPVIECWNEDVDAPRLLPEALQALCLKAAVLTLTDNGAMAELLISPPVDEMVHAILAQHELIRRIEAELGIRMVHMTDNEELGWKPGDFTDQAYQAAGWGVRTPATGSASTSTAAGWRS